MNETLLRRIFRSPSSGVAHDVAAAYAVVAEHCDGLLDAIARERLALGAEDRESVFAFVAKVDRLRAAQATVDELFPDATPVRAPTEDPQAPIALAESVDAEPATGMRAHQHHFSASALNAFVECPRKWFYRYQCGAVEDAGSSASFYGSAFHAALEEFHVEFTRPHATQERAMRDRIAVDVVAAFESYRDDFDTAVEFELQLRRAQRTAKRYVSWLIERAKRAPFEVIGRELPAALEIEGFDFIGFIDRLDRDEKNGEVTIIDYKTGAIAASAAEYRDKIRKFRDFQLPFYYWARSAQGDRVLSLALVPLKDALLDVRPIELEVVPVAGGEDRRKDAAFGTIGINDLERARAKMAEICRELTGGDVVHFSVTDDPTACTYCAYQSACNDRPAPAQERFGR